MSKETTKFRILSSTDGGRLWKLLPAEVEAPHRDAALNRFAETVELADGQQVSAVPARSWQPVVPQKTVRTVTKFQKVGGAPAEREIEGAAV